MKLHHSRLRSLLLVSAFATAPGLTWAASNDPVDPVADPELFNRSPSSTAPLTPPANSNTPPKLSANDCKTELADANKWLARCNAARSEDKTKIDALNAQIAALTKTVASLKDKLTKCKKDPVYCKGVEIPQ